MTKRKINSRLLFRSKYYIWILNLLWVEAVANTNQLQSMSVMPLFVISVFV